MGIAVSAAPSEAAKKKRMKAQAPGTFYGQLCTRPSVTAGVGAVMIWGYGNKWYQAAFTPGCASPGAVAVRSKAFPGDNLWGRLFQNVPTSLAGVWVSFAHLARFDRAGRAP